MAKKRTPEDIFHAWGVLKMMLDEGYELFPLGLNYSKRPRDEGWNLHDYTGFDWRDHMNRSGNVGVRARPCDLLMDIDPKNGGLLSFAMLQYDAGDTFESYPIVHTGRGNGGFHIYMRLPPGERWRWHLKEYPGIDFQTFGRYTVAPGSLHPDTGKPYVLEGPHMAFLTECKRLAPAGLLSMLKKPPRPVKTGRGGQVRCDELKRLLDCLDAADFGQGGPHHDEWLDIAMACHNATDGEGVDEWLDWCATDDRYGDDARNLNLARWDSFDFSRSDGVTYKTLLRAVVRAGFPRVVAGLHLPEEVKADFSDDDLMGIPSEEDEETAIPDEDY